MAGATDHAATPGETISAAKWNAMLNDLPFLADANTFTNTLTIDQDSNAISLDIDSEATTADIVNIAPTVLTTGNVIDVADADALTTGKILNLVSNSSDTGTRSLVQVTNDNTSATGATTLSIQQDSTAKALFVDHNGNGIALDIDSEATTANGINVDADVLTTGSILNLASNASNTSSRNLVKITNDHAAATGTTALTIQQDSTGKSLVIDQNGNATAFNIDAETTTASIFNIAPTVLTTGIALNISDADALTTGNILNLVSNSSDTSTRNLLQIRNDNTSATGATVVEIRQDAAQDALFIDHNANGIALNIDSEATTSDVINVDASTLTSGNALDVSDANALTTGSILNLASSSASTETRYLASIVNTGGNGARCLYLQQDSTRHAFEIDQNGNGHAMVIDSESTSGAAIQINCDTYQNSNIVSMADADALTTGSFFNMVSNSNDPSTRSLVKIVNDNTSATGATPLFIQQDAAQDAIFIDQNGNGIALDIDSEATTASAINISATAMTTGNIFAINDADALTTGKMINLYSNSSDTSTRSLVKIHSDHASATGATLLELLQDSTGPALSVTGGMTMALDEDVIMGNIEVTTPDEDIRVTASSITLYDSSGYAVILNNVDVTAVNTASVGANGPDTRAVQASTWYDVYVIYNGTTTASLLTESLRSGTADANVANHLDDTSEDFTADPVITSGDRIYNTTDNTFGFVNEVAPSADTSRLSIKDSAGSALDLFPAGTETYVIERTPVLPTGYTYRRYVGSVITDGTSDFIVVSQINGRCACDGSAQQPLSSGTATSMTAVSLSAYVPPKASSVFGDAHGTAASATSDLDVGFKVGSTATMNFTPSRIRTTGTSATAQFQSMFEVDLVEPQRLYYQRFSIDTANVNIHVAGWHVPHLL